MPRFTEADYKAFLARSFKDTKHAAPYEDEGKLQQEIREDVQRRGWICFYSRMDVPATTRIGTPDFIIGMDGGRTLYVECKSKNGKVEDEQAATIAWLRKLGHRVVVVASMKEYLESLK